MFAEDHNFEWLKILVSAMVGLFAGLIAEPIKSVLQRKIEIIHLERAIEIDALDVLTLVSACQSGRGEKSEFFETPMMSAFEHYWNSKRELFYVDFDLHHLLTLCKTINFRIEDAKQGRIDINRAFDDVESTASHILTFRRSQNAKRSFVNRMIVRFVQ